MAYGHGISVSLVQLARAYTVFARDGELVPLTLVKTSARGERREGAVERRPRARCARCWSWRCSPAAPGRAPASWAGGSPARPAPRTSRRTAAMPRTSTSPPSSASRRRRAPRLVVAVMIDEPSAGAALRRRGRRAGVRAGHAGRAAPARRAARRAARAARAAARRRRGEGEHLMGEPCRPAHANSCGAWPRKER